MVHCIRNNFNSGAVIETPFLSDIVYEVLTIYSREKIKADASDIERLNNQ